MKRTSIAAVALASLIAMPGFGQVTDSQTPATPSTLQTEVDGSGGGNTVREKEEKYRRSSLCLVFLTHKGRKYAQEMEYVLTHMPMPDRYNDHSVMTRVISVSGRQTKKKIIRMMQDKDVARQLVARWFNRDSSTGEMNMNLIHERGGFSASFEDLQRAQVTVRGKAMLSDEGEELLKNTYVMVCDMDYYDKHTTGQVFSGIFSAVALGAAAYAQDQAKKGHTENAMYGQLGAMAGVAGAAVASQVGGFAVKMKAHLFRLEWSDRLRDKIYREYWVDSSTPESERIRRKAAFENDKSSFKMEYCGSYMERSSKTTWNKLDQQNIVIQQVCQQTLQNGLVQLSRQFPQFKIKAPVYTDGRYAYSYIGSKEGMRYKTKYDVLKPVKTRHGISYKKVGVLKPMSVWNNRNFNMATDELTEDDHGSRFTIQRGGLNQPGLLLREKGKKTYKYKKNMFSVGFVAMEASKVSDENVKDASNEEYRYRNFDSCDDSPSWIYGVEVGWTMNFGTNFAWTFLDGLLSGGSNATYMAIKTGPILRTRPFGKNGRRSLFLQMMIGYRYFTKTVHYTYSTGYGKWYSWDDDDLEVSKTGFDFQGKLGLNITKNLFVALQTNDVSEWGFTIGWNF